VTINGAPWTDNAPDSATCDDYSSKQWCTADGDAGPGWNFPWSLGAYSNFGHTANTACCACGGGVRGPKIVINGILKRFSVDGGERQYANVSLVENIQTNTGEDLSFDGCNITTNGYNISTDWLLIKNSKVVSGSTSSSTSFFEVRALTMFASRVVGRIVIDAATVYLGGVTLDDPDGITIRRTGPLFIQAALIHRSASVPNADFEYLRVIGSDGALKEGSRNFGGDVCFYTGSLADQGPSCIDQFLAAPTTSSTTVSSSTSTDEPTTEPCEDVTINGAPWADTDGDGCNGYLGLMWCTADGGYGPGWSIGTFEDYQNNGHTGLTACCACGGGVRSTIRIDGEDVHVASLADSYTGVTVDLTEDITLTKGITFNQSTIVSNGF
jgi:hypothetical protein